MSIDLPLAAYLWLGGDDEPLNGVWNEANDSAFPGEKYHHNDLHQSALDENERLKEKNAKLYKLAYYKPGLPYEGMFMATVGMSDDAEDENERLTKALSECAHKFANCEVRYNQENKSLRKQVDALSDALLKAVAVIHLAENAIKGREHTGFIEKYLKSAEALIEQLGTKDSTICDDCGKNQADTRNLCPGCREYRQHTGHF